MVNVDEVSFINETNAYQETREGRFIINYGLQYAHQADFIRLRALLEYGGVYADIDTLFVKPYPKNFFSLPAVMGRECTGDEDEKLCNALIMAEKDSLFIKKWLERMYEVFDGTWNRHSCIEPSRLSKEMPEFVEVVDKEYFFHYTYTVEGLASLFGSVDMPDEHLCSIHMWSHLWWESTRNDFIRFHHGMLTEEFIKKYDTTYNLLARKFLD